MLLKIVALSPFRVFNFIKVGILWYFSNIENQEDNHDDDRRTSRGDENGAKEGVAATQWVDLLEVKKLAAIENLDVVL